MNVFLCFSVSEGKLDRPLPVLVFVHGDDNSYGSGFPYDPSMLVSQGNIIVITFNFRLGILGKEKMKMRQLTNSLGSFI
jgi:carboxylesterase type B